MIPKQVQIILEEIAKENNIPLPVIEQIYKSQFITLRDNIRSGTNETYGTIMLPNFGKFYSNEYRRMKIFEKKKPRNGKNQTEK